MTFVIGFDYDTIFFVSRRGRIIVGGEVQQWIGSAMNTFSTFEGLEDTVKRLNKTLEKDPIPGSGACCFYFNCFRL